MERYGLSYTKWGFVFLKQSALISAVAAERLIRVSDTRSKLSLAGSRAHDLQTHGSICVCMRTRRPIDLALVVLLQPTGSHAPTNHPSCTARPHYRPMRMRAGRTLPNQCTDAIIAPRFPPRHPRRRTGHCLTSNFRLGSPVPGGSRRSRSARFDRQEQRIGAQSPNRFPPCVSGPRADEARSRGAVRRYR